MKTECKEPVDTPVNVGVLNGKIVLLSHAALFQLLKLGWYWGNRPADEDIDHIVTRFEDDPKSFINDADGKILDRKKIVDGLELAINGQFDPGLTTRRHIKSCFDEFSNNVFIGEGKAELLMRVILHRTIKDVTEAGYKEIIQYRQREEKINATPKVKKASLSRVFARIKYYLKNEFEPKYINGKLTVRKHGNKYQVIAQSTTDTDTLIVWDNDGVEVRSAEWINNCDVRLFCGFEFITLHGPKDKNKD